jgi:hypothetical protein
MMPDSVSDDNWFCHQIMGVVRSSDLDVYLAPSHHHKLIQLCSFLRIYLSWCVVVMSLQWLYISVQRCRKAHEWELEVQRLRQSEQLLSQYKEQLTASEARVRELELLNVVLKENERLRALVDAGFARNNNDQ